MMKVIFSSKDFASVEGAGLGFNNRRPMTQPWQYQGRVQHRQWQGTYECAWEGTQQGVTDEGLRHNPAGHTPELVWSVRGDARLFGLAAALKARGFAVQVEQE